MDVENSIIHMSYISERSMNGQNSIPAYDTSSSHLRAYFDAEIRQLFDTAMTEGVIKKQNQNYERSKRVSKTLVLVTTVGSARLLFMD